MKALDIAKVAHATQNAYREVTEPDTEILDWGDMDKAGRDSIIAGVEWVMNNPATTAEKQHNAWVKYKQDNGWMYAEKKSNTLRTHPMLIPFSKLSLQHKTKDSLFVATVQSLLPMQNYIGSKA